MKSKKERLNMAYEELRGRGLIHSQKEFAAAINTKQSNVSYAMNGKDEYLTDGFVRKVTERFPFFSYDWLVDGVGEMLIDGEQRNGKVPVIPISEAAGAISDFEGRKGRTAYETVISPINNIDYALTVTGDSMSPEYPSGSRVLIKKIDETLFIDWGRTYVLDTKNGVVMKNVFPSIDENGRQMNECIICRSINPDYPDFRMNLNDGTIFGIYRVLLSFSLK